MMAIESIDLNRDYWKLSAYDMLAVNGHIYLTKPAFIIPSVGIFTFNKQMLAEYDMAEPYQDVLDGKWTLDKMAEMSKVVTRDLNGDGKMDENDTYGFVCGADWQLNAFIFSLGSSVTDLDENGKIVLSLNTPHSAEVYTALHEFFNNSGDAWFNGGVDMKSGRCLFAQTTTKALDNLRDCEVEYGVVPYPKWDEAQERYNGYDISSFISIPSSVSDPEMVGQTLEMLNFYSRELVLPTYYDISLNTKSVRDEESIQMLDIIFNDIYCDAGRTYFGLDNGAMFNLVYSVSHHVYTKKTGDIASHFAKNQKSAQKCIDNFYKAVDSNE
jgi:ABC-type glycerol-3-phosphate transport system substrate-binding protein